MCVTVKGVSIGALSSDHQPHPEKDSPMTSKLKEALLTTGVVLATVYVLNKVSFTRNIVQEALK